MYFLLLLLNILNPPTENSETETLLAERDGAKMNIIFFNIEDLTTEAIHCYGNDIVKTPHLDKLADEGILFRRAYCQGPICGPSRSSFTSGLRPETTNVYQNLDCFQEVAPTQAKGLAHYLNNENVAMINIGKLFHADYCARDMLERFDRLEFSEYKPEGFTGIFNKIPKKNVPEKDFIYSQDPEIEKELVRRRKVLDTLSIPRGVPGWWENGGGAFFSLYFELTGDIGMDEVYTGDGQKIRTAVEIIKQMAEKDEQFFMSIGLGAPHVPLQAPEKYVNMYDPEKIPLPEIDPVNDVGIPTVAKRFGKPTDIFQTDQIRQFPQLAETPQRVREVIASYYACVSFIDAQVGLVLQALEDAGLADNTMVIFFADHGFHLGEHGLWSKRSMFEQSTRVPLIVKLPGAKGNGQECDEIVELVDLLPTMTEFWNSDVSTAGFEGISFLPLLENPSLTWKKAAFTTSEIMGNMAHSVRTKRYRYTQWDVDNQKVYEFYDLNTDPGEQHNLIDDPSYKLQISNLKNFLKEGWTAALPNNYIK